MIRKKCVMAAVTLLILSAACKTNHENTAVENGIDLSNMDTTVNPVDDFYIFVNGNWEEKTEIPADQSRWGNFNELSKMTDENTLAVLQKAIESGKYGPETDQAKAALFYQTAMDTIYLNELGIEPSLEEYRAIDNISSMADLQQFLIAKAPNQMRYFYSFGVDSDRSDSDKNAGYLGTGALGLPERDYYLNDDDDTREIQEKYKKHMVRMFGFFAVEKPEATKIAEEVFALEQQMGGAKMSKEDRRNPLLRNNPRSIDQLSQITPAINWDKYFTGIGISIDTVVITDLKYYEELNNILKEENLSGLKNYMKWTFINDVASILSTDLDRANFDFYGKVLSGQQKQQPRSERILNQANWTIGEAIGKLYVDEYFPAEAKASAEAMVKNILTAFGERINNLDWMSDSTKQKALTKLGTFKVKIGYPDQWKDYSDLKITGKDNGGSHYQNMQNIHQWNWEKDLKKLHEPVDKSEWFMAPQIVNAYYNPPYNEIVFPAAILQPPFYNYQADAAVNYGGIGAVIGHEISHGFDDQGSRFDADGN
ncbi:MAG: M13 family metallopeptidase, partial [Cyclobacteriaceae bacterium]